MPPQRKQTAPLSRGCCIMGSGGIMPQTLTAPGLTTGHAPFVEEARSRGDLYISQPYDLYSKENHDTWRRLYERIRPRWERYANDHFLHGIKALSLPADRVPRLDDINRRLAQLT